MKYLYEDKPLGTVGALKQLENKVNGNLILTNCDIIINADYSDLLKYHDSVNNDITLVVSMKHYNIPYGICEIENGGTLLEIKEKPEYDLLVNTGMYVLKSDTLKYIPQNEYFHITHLIEKIKKAGMKVGVYPISENSWFDTGEWVEYKKTLEQFKL
jgi:NDP-sugar pyrophosphorylase family protein